MSLKSCRAVAFFLGGLVLALLAGVYTQLQVRESFHFKMAMDQPLSRQTLDLAEQSWPKHLLQPGYFHIRGSRTDCKNEGTDPLRLHIALSGGPAWFMLYRPEAGYETQPADFTVEIPPGEWLHYRIDVQLPREAAWKDRAGEIQLEVQEQNQRQRCHRQIFSVVNGAKVAE